MEYENDEQRQDDLEEVIKPTTLEEFLFQHPVSNDTKEVVISERLKDYHFKIGTMTQKQRDDYINASLVRGKNGSILKQNLTKGHELVVINHCLYPDFKSVDFLQKCGCKTPAEALYRVLKVGEVEFLSQLIMEFNGFEDFEELQKQAKN